MLYDLHVHTTASDGVLTPEEVLDLAVSLGLAGIAISDHDTVDGLDTALNYLREHKLPLYFVPGIELNTDAEDDEIHILGYYIDYSGMELKRRLDEIRGFRRERALSMIERLGSMGLVITMEQVERLARGDLIGRPHIAQALIEQGYIKNIKEAFKKYIGQGCPAYVPRYKFPPAEAIDLIHQAGGLAVLAHPGLIKHPEKINKIIELGINGLEVHYPEHTEGQVLAFKILSQERGLLITGGSDFHGLDSTESHARLGAMGITGDDFLRFRQQGQKN